MLTTGEIYRDLGGDYFPRLDPERTAKHLVAKLQELGHTVTLEELPQAAERQQHRKPSAIFLSATPWCG